MTVAERKRLEWLDSYVKLAYDHSSRLEAKFGFFSPEAVLARREWCVACEIVRFIRTGESDYLNSRCYNLDLEGKGPGYFNG